jgi:hypothetical protein
MINSNKSQINWNVSYNKYKWRVKKIQEGKGEILKVEILPVVVVELTSPMQQHTLTSKINIILIKSI